MDAHLARDLAARFVSGDRLTTAEEQGLLAWLRDHREARAELLADESIDSLLGCLSRLHETGESFVHDTLCRVVGPAPSCAPPPEVLPAPSAAPPPAMVVCPLPSPPDARLGRKRMSATARRWSAAIISASAAVLVGALGWWLAIEANRPPGAVPDARPPAIAEAKDTRQESAGGFATLVQATGAVWDTPRVVGERLAAGVLKLTQGKAEFQFDTGTVALLTGPAVLELRSAGEVSLRRGSLTARVPKQAIGFAVVTPLARVVDLGTEFDVVVDEAGGMQTLVRQGRVSLRPQRNQEQPGKAIELAAGALDRAEVSVPNMAAAVLPVTIVARGGEGRFRGMVSVDGRTAEFSSPEALGEFQTRALRQLRQAPHQFAQQWSALVEGSGPGTKGSSPPATDGAKPAPSRESGRRLPANATAGSGGKADAHTRPSPRTVEVKENGRTIAITDSKESGITVTITEMANGKKKTTQVKAATAAELAKKNPDAHRLYRQYYHGKAKTGKKPP